MQDADRSFSNEKSLYTCSTDFWGKIVFYSQCRKDDVDVSAVLKPGCLCDSCLLLEPPQFCTTIESCLQCTCEPELCLGGLQTGQNNKHQRTRELGRNRAWCVSGNSVDTDGALQTLDLCW